MISHTRPWTVVLTSRVVREALKLNQFARPLSFVETELGVLGMLEELDEGVHRGSIDDREDEAIVLDFTSRTFDGAGPTTSYEGGASKGVGSAGGGSLSTTMGVARLAMEDRDSQIISFLERGCRPC